MQYSLLNTVWGPLNGRLRFTVARQTMVDSVCRMQHAMPSSIVPPETLAHPALHMVLHLIKRAVDRYSCFAYTCGIDRHRDI